jgi:hypothetical protein
MIWFHTAVALLACAPTAADWPQWLGPTRDGAAADTVKPWTAAPAVLWRTQVGEGHSSPVVAGGKVYLHYRCPPSRKAVRSKGGKEFGKSAPPIPAGAPRDTPCHGIPE